MPGSSLRDVNAVACWGVRMPHRSHAWRESRGEGRKGLPLDVRSTPHRARPAARHRALKSPFSSGLVPCSSRMLLCIAVRPASQRCVANSNVQASCHAGNAAGVTIRSVALPSAWESQAALLPLGTGLVGPSGNPCKPSWSNPLTVFGKLPITREHKVIRQHVAVCCGLDLG